MLHFFHTGVQKERMHLDAEDMYVLSSDGYILSTPSLNPYPHKPTKCSDLLPFMKVFISHLMFRIRLFATHHIIQMISVLILTSLTLCTLLRPYGVIPLLSSFFFLFFRCLRCVMQGLLFTVLGCSLVL